MEPIFGLNKTPMGHIAHLRKQFKSLNKYDFIITLIQRIKKNSYKNLLFFIWTNLNPLPPLHALCKIWLILAQWFLRRTFLNFINIFYYFVIIFAGPIICRNLNHLHSRMFWGKFGWYWPSGLGEENFLKFCQSIPVFAIS